MTRSESAITADCADYADHARAVAGSVPDPELPMLTIADLGILRSVEVCVAPAGTTAQVVLTPTYLGCPALAEMAGEVTRRLTAAGCADVAVRIELTPPWTTDDITAAGRRKLAAAGIAPPGPAPRRTGPVPVTLAPAARRVPCPRCGAAGVEQSAFSATACKALYRCGSCDEPFEYVKEI